MPFAVTHFVTGLLIATAACAIFKRKPTIALLLAGGIGGTILDTDVLFDVFRLTQIHRVFTHNLIVPLILFVVAAVLASTKWRPYALFPLIFGFAWVSHLTLDCAIAYTPEMSIIPGVPMNFCGPNTGWMFQGALDGAIFLSWVGYLLWQRKLRALL